MKRSKILAAISFVTIGFLFTFLFINVASADPFGQSGDQDQECDQEKLQEQIQDKEQECDQEKLQEQIQEMDQDCDQEQIQEQIQEKEQECVQE